VGAPSLAGPDTSPGAKICGAGTGDSPWIRGVNSEIDNNHQQFLPATMLILQ
jgi:hypothetical protein